jgi:hypothetical protein
MMLGEKVVAVVPEKTVLMVAEKSQVVEADETANISGTGSTWSGGCKDRDRKWRTL